MAHALSVAVLISGGLFIFGRLNRKQKQRNASSLDTSERVDDVGSTEPSLHHTELANEAIGVNKIVEIQAPQESTLEVTRNCEIEVHNISATMEDEPQNNLLPEGLSSEHVNLVVEAADESATGDDFIMKEPAIVDVAVVSVTPTNRKLNEKLTSEELETSAPPEGEKPEQHDGSESEKSVPLVDIDAVELTSKHVEDVKEMLNDIIDSCPDSEEKFQSENVTNASASSSDETLAETFSYGKNQIVSIPTKKPGRTISVDLSSSPPTNELSSEKMAVSEEGSFNPFANLTKSIAGLATAVFPPDKTL